MRSPERPALALAREADPRPCPRCGEALTTVWTAAGAIPVAVPARLDRPRLVVVEAHRCGKGVALARG
jgi:hypothetical protein